MAIERIPVMGIFESETQVASAIRGLRNTSYTLERVHSPIPSHTIDEAMGSPKSAVGWFTLAGGITGFLTGFLLAIFTATRWNLIVSGKPIVSLVPFFVVGFEFTILFAVFGNILGLISQTKLPRFIAQPTYHQSFSCDRYGILASCEAGREKELSRFFESKGARIEIHPPTPIEELGKRG